MNIEQHCVSAEAIDWRDVWGLLQRRPVDALTAGVVRQNIPEGYMLACHVENRVALVTVCPNCAPHFHHNISHLVLLPLRKMFKRQYGGAGWLCDGGCGNRLEGAW